jgi:hypothetical protein
MTTSIKIDSGKSALSFRAFIGCEKTGVGEVQGTPDLVLEYVDISQAEFARLDRLTASCSNKTDLIEMVAKEAELPEAQKRRKIFAPYNLDDFKK